MTIDISIFNKITRKRDWLIFIYLTMKSPDRLTTTYREISSDTDYSVKQIRTSLLSLQEQGYIKVHASLGIGIDIVLHSQKTLKNKTVKENNVKDRKTAFYNSLIGFLNQYPKETLRAFFDYWSEFNKSGTKMRWENEKTWELKLRLSNWANREKEYGKRNNASTKSANDKAASRKALDDLASGVLEQY